MAGIKLVECNKRQEYYINNTYCSRYRCDKSGNGKCKWLDIDGKKIKDLPPCTVIEGIWLPLEGLAGILKEAAEEVLFEGDPLPDWVFNELAAKLEEIE